MNLNDKINEIENSLVDFYEDSLIDDLYSALRTKNYTKALKISNEFLENNPDMAYSYYQRGVCKYKLGFILAAAEDFTKCIDMKPNKNPEVYYLRGVCNSFIIDFERAAI